MAKKPVESETVASDRAETETVRSGVQDYIAPDGYVLVKQADWDELQRNLKMAR